MMLDPMPASTDVGKVVSQALALAMRAEDCSEARQLRSQYDAALLEHGSSSGKFLLPLIAQWVKISTLCT